MGEFLLFMQFLGWFTIILLLVASLIHIASTDIGWTIMGIFLLTCVIYALYSGVSAYVGY